MRRIPSHITLLTVVISIFLLPFIFASCGENNKSAISIDYDSGAIPTIATDSVSMLISDSGIVRYKVISQTWDVYDQVKDKYWHYPDGLYLEQFDSVFNVVVSVKADTAWNFVNKKIWKLKGNVFIESKEDGITYKSDEFYWDQQKKEIYSDSLVEIIQPGEIVMYAGEFVSDQQMTNPRFKNVGRHFLGKTMLYIKEDEEEGGRKQ